ncbi:MAG: alginate lyase family protein [Clostridia bacterium]|nr:alginate lyase family protein [Clostridia bacterium]
MQKKDLLALAASLTEDAGAKEKYASHLEELFLALSPEKMGEEYRKALRAEDAAGAARAAAAYFREKPEAPLPFFRDPNDFDRERADRAVRGEMREINVDWTFPEGKIDFLFDPTLIHGPRNNEWLWQFNRHSYWSDMAFACRETRDGSYAKAFERQLLTWIAQTDCPETGWNEPGSAWRTIECGIRLLGSWQIAFQIFRKAPEVSDLALLLMLASMRRQALHLKEHPQSANWLMLESNGVYAFASLCPEFREAEELRKLSAARLTREMEKQTLPDGMHYELSPDYHGVVVGCVLRVFEIACLTGFRDEFPPRFAELAERSVLAAVLLSTPALTQPRTNDCYTIQTEVFTGIASRVLPPRPEYDFVNSRRAEGNPPEGKTASAFLPWAGFAVMRSGWEEDALYLSFDVGPLGQGHQHQDKLNVNLYKGGEELIFDDGGGQYEISEARKYGVSAYDHNTVLVDGLAQDRRGPLVSEKEIDAGWITRADFDYAEGTYEEGFGPDGARLASHTRRVRFEKPDFFCLRDEMSSLDGRAHAYEVLFHMDTLRCTRPEGFPGAILSDFGKEYEILVVPVASEGEEEPTAVSGRTGPTLRGWYVGRNEETLHPALTVGRKSLPAKDHVFHTLLVPVKRGESLPVIEREGDTLRVTFRGRKCTLTLCALWKSGEDGKAPENKKDGEA